MTTPTPTPAEAAAWHDVLALVRTLDAHDIGTAAELVAGLSESEHAQVTFWLAELARILAGYDLELITAVVRLKLGEIDPETGEPT